MLLEQDEVRSLNEQIARLAPGEPYLAVVVDGKVIVRSTKGISQTLLQLWRKEPTMMVPDSLRYRPATRDVDLRDLQVTKAAGKRSPPLKISEFSSQTMIGHYSSDHSRRARGRHRS